jgi:hypothetical protein
MAGYTALATKTLAAPALAQCGNGPLYWPELATRRSVRLLNFEDVAYAYDASSDNHRHDGGFHCHVAVSFECHGSA